MTGNKRWLLVPLLLLLNARQSSEAIRIPPRLKKPPIITDQTPESYTVFPTDDIVLKCEATGVPAPEFRWTKDGRVYDPSLDPRASMNRTSGTIVIATTGNGVSIRGYRGTYRCYSSNEYGTAISSNIHLVTESTPKWPKESVRKFEKEEGESLVLQCNPPTSMASSMIIWMTSKLFNIKLSERVSQGMNGNLYFSNLLVEDSLEDYTCYAQIPGTRTIIQKEPIALQVTTSNLLKHIKPRLLHPTGQSSSRLALRGRALYLECIAEGLPTPTVHWERLDGNFPPERISYESFNKTLKISDVTEDDDGEYRCTVKNSQGQVKHTYSVSVEAAPYWVKKPQDGIYSPGETVRLDCDIDAKPKAEIRWKVNGVLLSETDSNPSRREIGSSIVLTSVQKEDTAIYQCEAHNKHGTLLANIIVQVIELPAQILTPPDKEYAIVERQTAFLYCRAFGSPTPTIQWTKEDVEAVLEDRRYFLNTSGTLRIEDALKTDGGIFTCNASNRIGTDSIRATLIIKNASRIIEAPRDQRVERQHPVTFHCVVEVDLSLQQSADVHWKKDGEPIDEADDDDSKYHIADTELKIQSVGYEDEGMYMCVAETELDTVMGSAQLTVLDRPEPPFDLEVFWNQEREVNLTWSSGDDHNSPINESIIEFEENIFDPGTWHVMRRVPGDQQLVALQLSPYVSYSFRVISVNQLGHSLPSLATKHFVTPSAAPEKNPRGVKGEGSQPNNMVISWQVLKPLDWNGPNLQYVVKWRRQSDRSEWKELVVQSSPYLVNSTPTFVPYEIQVQAFNQEGSGPEPKTVIGYSGEDYPLSSPEIVSVVNTNSTSVRVTWTPVSDQSLRGHLRGYNISYWKQPGVERHHRIVRGNHTDTLLGGLEPYTTYNLAMTVFNGKGESDVTHPPRQFRTPEGVPSQPAMLRLELLKDTEVTASWSRPHKPNGILIGYVLQYQQINGTEGGPLRELNISSPGTTSFTVHSLQPQSIYKFHVMGLTLAGRGRALAREIFTSREGEPKVVKNISYVAGDMHANISWIGLEGHRVTELLIQYANKDGAGDWKYSRPVNSSQNFFMLDGLQPGTMYRVQLWQLGRFKNISIWEKEVETNGPASTAFTETNNGIASQGWFIGLISAIVLLILILLIVCFIKRNKGGKYSVKDKEDAHVDSEARPMKDETFGEYSDNDQEEKPFEGSQPSLDAQIKPLGSDDSLVEYGGSVDVQFNEDGSFIGQYSGKKEDKEAGGANGSSGGNSPVNVDITLD
ncbi:neural cell adhesion molecule L1-like isoform X2 [Carcharodon carcharias]|uniref:neural cell adhesion molecule L1-like isoform X2 n=1 Tax=Carcharodon carcharias TaxID=13397 RepID=UPI001B7EFF84|nr:neural cell adhesion molecule L1-like isoform X2 [Carcharodon carcharias]